jgi:hypothetical protein
VSTLNPHDDLNVIESYQKQAQDFLRLSSAKADAMSEMIDQLNGLINPDAPPIETFWIFVDARGKKYNPRDGKIKPSTTPMGRRGVWREVMFV